MQSFGIYVKNCSGLKRVMHKHHPFYHFRKAANIFTNDEFPKR
ncbi:hypothetical protein CHCC20335_4398 [Bacillus paralicheniformis]|nr:hypothetical protein CHCC20335_4398 [Bacillus paralicheniformis]